jgi:hypothetical protein
VDCNRACDGQITNKFVYFHQIGVDDPAAKTYSQLGHIAIIGGWVTEAEMRAVWEKRLFVKGLLRGIGQLRGLRRWYILVPGGVAVGHGFELQYNKEHFSAKNINLVLQSQRGPKVTSLLRAPRAAVSRNNCVGFADVTRKRCVRCASCTCSPRIVQMLRANVLAIITAERMGRYMYILIDSISTWY